MGTCNSFDPGAFDIGVPGVDYTTTERIDPKTCEQMMRERMGREWPDSDEQMVRNAARERPPHGGYPGKVRWSTGKALKEGDLVRRSDGEMLRVSRSPTGEPCHITEAQKARIRAMMNDPDADFGGRIPFAQTDAVEDESYDTIDRTRHDDIDPIKRARWEGVFVGIPIGIVLTMAAVAWRVHGTLLP